MMFFPLSFLLLLNYSFRSLFIWRPKEKSEPVEKKDESNIIICGGAKKKRKGNFGGESDDDSEEDRYIAHATTTVLNFK